MGFYPRRAVLGGEVVYVLPPDPVTAPQLDQPLLGLALVLFGDASILFGHQPPSQGLCQVTVDSIRQLFAFSFHKVLPGRFVVAVPVRIRFHEKVCNRSYWSVNGSG